MDFKVLLVIHFCACITYYSITKTHHSQEVKEVSVVFVELKQN